MVTTSIDLKVTGAQQAAGDVKGVSDSVGSLTEKMNGLAKAGDFAGAANITHQIDNAQKNAVPFSTVSNGGGFYSGGSASASKLDMRLELLNKTIEELTSQLAEATESGRTREAYNLSASLNNVEQEKQRLEAERKRNESENSAGNAIKKYGLSRYFTQGLGYAQQAFGIGYNYRTAMANGDYLGAPIGTLESLSGMAQGIGGSLIGAGALTGWNPVGWTLLALGGLAELGGTIGNVIAGDKRADNAEQSAYERSLVHTGALNRRFANGGTWQDNANRGMDIINKATEYAQGTTLSAYDLTDLATQMSQYGATDVNTALLQARNVAMRSNNTGVDSGVVASFLGTALRYGSGSGDILGYTSQARQAAGLTKAQDQEFLQALQGVIEDGISSGYVKSVEDVSNTMVMFARLSDNNPMWQGQQGANRLRQMNSGIASATELQSVNDVLVLSATKSILDSKNLDERRTILGRGATGTYIDNMLLMEQGNNPEMFGAIAKSIMDMENGDSSASIERVKDIFKVNYHGATDIYSMMQEYITGNMSEENFARQVKDAQAEKDYTSDETKRNAAILNIEKQVTKSGQSKYWESTKDLEKEAAKSSGGSVMINPNDNTSAARNLSYRLDGDVEYATKFAIEGVGDDEKDAIWNSKLKLYAEKGGLKGWTGKHKKADGRLTNDERIEALKTFNNSPIRKIYENGTAEEFANALDKMFQRLFGNCIILDKQP